MFGLDDFLSIGKAIVDSLVGLTVQVLKVVATAFIEIGKQLGLINKGTDAEDLGDKALQAEEQGISPENYDSFEEFVNSLDDFEKDPLKTEKYSEEDKLKKGVEVATSLIAEKYENLDIEDLAKCAVENSDYFTPERMKEFGELMKTSPDTVNDLVKYLNGTELNDAKLAKDETFLVRIEKAINPLISDDEALQTVRKAQK